MKKSKKDKKEKIVKEKTKKEEKNKEKMMKKMKEKEERKEKFVSRRGEQIPPDLSQRPQLPAHPTRGNMQYSHRSSAPSPRLNEPFPAKGFLGLKKGKILNNPPSPAAEGSKQYEPPPRL